MTNPPIRQSPWHLPLFRRLWYGTVIISLANQCERLAAGWLVLVETDSVFLTAASFAIQKAPASLSAPVAGDLSDRIPRSRLLAATAMFKAIILILLGAVAYVDTGQIWPVFVLMALSGIGMSFETPSTQGLITDIVPREMAMRAVAMQSTGARAIGALGSLGGGLLIAGFGVPMTLFAGSGIFLIGFLAMASMRVPAAQQQSKRIVGKHIFRDAAQGLVMLLKLNVVRALLLTAFVVEMFAFAYSALMPSLARDVLHMAADGLGTLNFMSGLGAVIGVAVLSAFGDVSRKGMLLIGVTVIFGCTLISFGLSIYFLLSLVLVMGVGAMAASFDALQWTLLQQHVPDDMRGRSIGGWMFVVGFGWMGQLALGAVAEFIGVQWALATAGGLVILTGLAAYALSPMLRET
ncbi:MAG: MFS transporter [Gemmatimonadota bacterium]|nr:MFS transporter [Gemmatimonadota bacterium]